MVKFSIITVTRNAAATLEQAIASVAAQHYRPHEYIIVDGASSDGTAAIIERHRDVVTRFVSEPDEGIYDAMNKGLALASGDFIYFLGADDYLIEGNVLGDIAAFLDAHPDTDFLYGGIEVRSGGGRVTNFMPPPPDEALDFMICGCLPHQASFASRRAFEVAGPFDIRYRIAGDYDWFLRVLIHPGLVTRRAERVVASYCMDGVSNRLADSQREVYAIQNSLPLFQQRGWMKRRLRVFRRELLAQRRRAAALAASPTRWPPFAKAATLGRLLFRDVAERVASLAASFSEEEQLRALEQQLLAQRIANDGRARGSRSASPIAPNAP